MRMPTRRRMPAAAVWWWMVVLLLCSVTVRIHHYHDHYGIIIVGGVSAFQPFHSSTTTTRTTTTTTATPAAKYNNNNKQRSTRILLPLFSVPLDDVDDATTSTTTTSTNQQKQKQRRQQIITGVTPREGPLNEAVATLLQQQQYQLDDDIDDIDTEYTNPLERANYLINIGAVWAKMEALNEDDLLSQYDDDSSCNNNPRTMYADLKGGSNDNKDDNTDDLDRYIEQMEQQRFRRILTPSRIEAGTDLRIYPHPRRFPSCYDFNSESILYEDTTFLVVDKPPMLPTQPDASNYEECCPGCVQKMLGPFVNIRGEPLEGDGRPLICHRVDSCVGGCVVLSKDRNGQRVFAQYQRDRKIRKVYLALTHGKPVPLGFHVHWMWSPQTIRGKVGGPPCQLISHFPPESRRKAREYWNRCVLEVVKCERIEIDDKSVLLGGGGFDNHDDEGPFYQSTIRLVTGRKHQVRAQLASLGCPIVKDTLYGPLSGLTLDQLNNDENDNDDESVLDDAVAQCRVPTEPIGLQAHAILFGGVKAKAGRPWWQQQKPTQ